MAAAIERRASARSAPAVAGWSPIAMLRPGLEITVVNIGARGLLIRTTTRVLPGKRVDLLLSGRWGRYAATGRILRCQLVSLSPACYEAAIAADDELAVGARVARVVGSG